MEILLGALVIIATILMARMIASWRLQRASQRILYDLREKGAVDGTTAVHLPYAKRDWLNPGLRDFRPKALKIMEQQGVIGRTPEGGYFLAKHDQPPPA